MSSLAIPPFAAQPHVPELFPEESIPPPLSDPNRVDELFQNGANFLEHQNFLGKWGVRINELKVEGDNGSEGATGKVVKTRYKSVVAKCYKIGQLDQGAWQDAHREARILAYLHSQNVIHIPDLYGASFFNEGPVLIFNDADLDLFDQMRCGGLQLEDLSTISEQGLRALEAFSKLHVTHNDIKPENICYCKGRKWTTIIDWESGSSAGNAEPNTNCTKCYLPPERLLQIPPANDAERCKADVWALGATIFTVFMEEWISFDTDSSLPNLHAIQQRVSSIPPKMIAASPLSENYFVEGSLRRCNRKYENHRPAVNTFANRRRDAEEFYQPFDEVQYSKLSELVLDLLKINPRKRPSPSEALVKHFPPRAHLQIAEATISPENLES